ncbi:hypothetical protein HYH03_015942 [Edaphochlamys debaryana]|uniref:Uncharacterized protein n=1 Tax=Edaphochlamys debaryana TaxID=47281 RepID=A0A835XIE5_9CHLO|nr:hypothetical protein HYH03_015942 [Edaphochlamys debaryana]|eukprot:KAG2485267.1 hypothetical protein HYH03_015942 [Edaphochlamys debaryana]
MTSLTHFNHARELVEGLTKRKVAYPQYSPYNSPYVRGRSAYKLPLGEPEDAPEGWWDQVQSALACSDPAPVLSADEPSCTLLGGGGGSGGGSGGGGGGAACVGLCLDSAYLRPGCILVVLEYSSRRRGPGLAAAAGASAAFSAAGGVTRVAGAAAVAAAAAPGGAVPVPFAVTPPRLSRQQLVAAFGEGIVGPGARVQSEHFAVGGVAEGDGPPGPGLGSGGATAAPRLVLLDGPCLLASPGPRELPALLQTPGGPGGRVPLPPVLVRYGTAEQPRPVPAAWAAERTAPGSEAGAGSSVACGSPPVLTISLGALDRPALCVLELDPGARHQAEPADALAGQVAGGADGEGAGQGGMAPAPAPLLSERLPLLVVEDVALQREVNALAAAAASAAGPHHAGSSSTAASDAAPQAPPLAAAQPAWFRSLLYDLGCFAELREAAAAALAAPRDVGRASEAGGAALLEVEQFGGGEGSGPQAGAEPVPSCTLRDWVRLATGHGGGGEWSSDRDGEGEGEGEGAARGGTRGRTSGRGGVPEREQLLVLGASLAPYAVQQGLPAVLSYVVQGARASGVPLLRLDAEVRAQNSGLGLAHLAVQRGDPSVMEALLLLALPPHRSDSLTSNRSNRSGPPEYGQDGAVSECTALFVTPGSGGITPLHLLAVCHMACPEVSQLLLSLCPFAAHAWFEVCDAVGVTAAQYALLAGNAELNEQCAEMLVLEAMEASEAEQQGGGRAGAWDAGSGAALAAARELLSGQAAAKPAAAEQASPLAPDEESGSDDGSEVPSRAASGLHSHTSGSGSGSGPGSQIGDPPLVRPLYQSISGEHGLIPVGPPTHMGRRQGLAPLPPCRMPHQRAAAPVRPAPDTCPASPDVRPAAGPWADGTEPTAVPKAALAASEGVAPTAGLEPAAMPATNSGAEATVEEEAPAVRGEGGGTGRPRLSLTSRLRSLRSLPWASVLHGFADPALEAAYAARAADLAHQRVRITTAFYALFTVSLIHKAAMVHGLAGQDLLLALLPAVKVLAPLAVGALRLRGAAHDAALVAGDAARNVFLAGVHVAGLPHPQPFEVGNIAVQETLTGVFDVFIQPVMEQLGNPHLALVTVAMMVGTEACMSYSHGFRGTSLLALLAGRAAGNVAVRCVLALWARASFLRERRAAGAPTGAGGSKQKQKEA